jgi:hypothetical protein
MLHVGTQRALSKQALGRGSIRIYHRPQKDAAYERMAHKLLNSYFTHAPCRRVRHSCDVLSVRKPAPATCAR